MTAKQLETPSHCVEDRPRDAFGVPLHAHQRVILYDHKRRQLALGEIIKVNRVTADVWWGYPGEITRHQARFRGKALVVYPRGS